MVPSEARESVNGSVLPVASGSTLKMLGKFTCADCSIIGITTMKMMSSTKTTSTNGVTFITGCGRNGLRSSDRTTLALEGAGHRGVARVHAIDQLAAGIE